jgi:hypothetical protein
MLESPCGPEVAHLIYDMAASVSNITYQGKASLAPGHHMMLLLGGKLGVK